MGPNRQAGRRLRKEHGLASAKSSSQPVLGFRVLRAVLRSTPVACLGRVGIPDRAAEMRRREWRRDGVRGCYIGASATPLQPVCASCTLRYPSCRNGSTPAGMPSERYPITRRGLPFSTALTPLLPHSPSRKDAERLHDARPRRTSQHQRPALPGGRLPLPGGPQPLPGAQPTGRTTTPQHTAQLYPAGVALDIIWWPRPGALPRLAFAWPFKLAPVSRAPYLEFDADSNLDVDSYNHRRLNVRMRRGASRARTRSAFR